MISLMDHMIYMPAGYEISKRATVAEMRKWKV